MSDLVKLKLTRDTVISRNKHGVKDEVIEVNHQIALLLRQANAAVIADADAKVGKLKAKS